MARFVNSGPIALFGGSFNPVHFGHLRIATELAELLQVGSIRMMPCALVPELGVAEASQRLAMVQLAINDQVVVQADDIELQMPAPLTAWIRCVWFVSKWAPRHRYFYVSAWMR